MPTKVKFVEYGEDAKAKIVSYGEDMKVNTVEYGEQMKLKIVDYGEDIKIKIVSGTSGCFITTACVKAKGLSDDCIELNTMRELRDNYIRSLPNGNEIIRKYYELSPQIVAKINNKDNIHEIYSNIYEQLLLEVKMVNQGKEEKAFRNYLRLFNELREKFLDK